MKFLGSISSALYNVIIFAWDLLLTLGNLIWFSRPVGNVTPEGHPGYGGQWPEHRPPQGGDSRSSCPGLNAMANHGILPRSGRGIRFTDVPEKMRATFNFSASFSTFLTLSAARMLNRSYSKGVFDLEELNLHNGIEHDASLTRLDTALQPNQAVIHAPLIEELFSFATGNDATGSPFLTTKDLSRILGKRRAESKVMNKEYSLRFIHKVISSVNSSIAVTVFGNGVDDLRVIISEERLPRGWESRVRKPNGLTIISLGLTALPIEIGIREAQWAGDTERATGPVSQAVEERA